MFTFSGYNMPDGCYATPDLQDDTEEMEAEDRLREYEEMEARQSEEAEVRYQEMLASWGRL